MHRHIHNDDEFCAYFIVCRGNHQCLQRGLGSLSRSWATKSESKYTSLECTEGRLEHSFNDNVEILCLQAKRLYDVLHKPFLKSKTKDS